jgi:hypothetical protein
MGVSSGDLEHMFDIVLPMVFSASRAPWVSFGDFAESDPQLAASLRALLHQYGRGMAYLATVRPDGGPRVHPVSPIVTDDGLYCFVIDSPKRRDLHRDGRYALHTFPSETTDVEGYLSGHARQVVNVSIVDHLAREHRAAPGVDWTLFEFSVDAAMLHRLSPGAEPVTWRRGPSLLRRAPQLVAA